MLQLYYTPGSPPSRACLQTIRILGLEVEIKNLDLLKGEHMSAEYLKINPTHQVPALIDGDFIVTESRAIMAYLVNSQSPGNDLYPTEPRARALIDQRLYFDAISFFELSVSILRPYFYGNPTIPADKVVKLKETLRLLESFLESSLYFAGSNPTIVDISILSTFLMFKGTFTNYGDLPNLSAWFERCRSLKGFEENLAGSKALEERVVAKGMSPVSLN